MKTLQEFCSIVEEEKSDYTKFDALVRAGLANKAQLQRIHRILDKMGEEKPVFNNADRMIIQNLFNRMAELITNNKQIYQRSRQAVREELEEGSIETSDYKVGKTGKKYKAHHFKVGEKETEQDERLQETHEASPHDPPFVLVLRRKAIRMYPDGTKIALYHNQKLNKVFSVPYGGEVEPIIQAEDTAAQKTVAGSVIGGRLTPGKEDDMNGRKTPYFDGSQNDPQKKVNLSAFMKGQTKPNLASKMPMESIEEAVMDQLHSIVKNKQATKVKFGNGKSAMVDGYTASAITQVHKALNDENKKKIADMVHKSPEHLHRVAAFAFSKVK